jgi:hypothetical protein
MLKVVVSTKDKDVGISFNTIEYEPVYFNRKWQAVVYRLTLLLLFYRRYKKLNVDLSVEIKELELKDHLILSNGR